MSHPTQMGSAHHPIKMRRNNPAARVPVSVIVITKNEEWRLARCLAALSQFDEVVVVDSGSTDATLRVAQDYGARTEKFIWNGRYPKKYQWCLDTLSLKYNHVLFVDADEVMTPGLVREIVALSWQGTAGFFVRGAYVIGGQILQHGLKNNKLCLFDKTMMHFPVVDDLECSEMGEIEGHYQPVLRPEFVQHKIKQLRSEMLHYTYDDWSAWQRKHQRYAKWEVYMDVHKAWPEEVLARRGFMKRAFRTFPALRPVIAFVHSYILKMGFLDGAAGFRLAASRARYYRMINVYASLASSKA